MTLHALTLPDDPAELPRWLEDRLLAPNFGQFLAELSSFFPAAPDPPEPPRHLLDSWLPTALNEGLDSIPRDVLSLLLKNPTLLADLQERITIDGGPYWDDVAERSDGLTHAHTNGKRALDRILFAEPPASQPRLKLKNGSQVVPSQRSPRPSGRGYKVWAIASTAVAVCLAVAVGGLLFSRPDEPSVMKSQIAWGWGKPSGVANEQSTPRDYLNKLAANAEEWQLYRPGDADGVGARIAEFRAGCTRLMHSPYGPLAQVEKDWLLEHCRAWAKELDGQQQALDSGTDPLIVRAQMDEWVRKVTATLREKANQLG